MNETTNYPGDVLLKPLHNYNNKYESVVWEHLEEIWGKEVMSQAGAVLGSRFDKKKGKTNK